MNSVIILALFLPLVLATNTLEVPEVRVLVVSGSNPSDGQIRILRSANARNYTVDLLKVEKADSEVAETLKYLETIGSKDNELIFLTPSDNMLMTQEAMIFALKVSHVALLGGGSVVMPYPKKNASSIPTKYDEEILDLEETIEVDYDFKSNSPRPITYQDWAKALRPYAKIHYLKVKAKQEQRKKALVYDNRFCALTGLNIAVKESLRTFLENPLTNGTGSLKNLCDKVATFGSLQHEMQVVFDDEAKVFNFVSGRPNGSVGIVYANGQDGSIIIYSPASNFEPVIFDTSDKMPFDISNMASGEIALKSKPCRICPDNVIPDLEAHFGSIQNYPVVHLVVVKSADILGFEAFLENLKNLTYPKARTMLTLIMSYENENSNVKEVLTKTREDLEKLYYKMAILSAPGIPTSPLFEKVWEMATMNPSDYLFIVDPITRLLDLQVIEHLLQQNRRMISPLLKIADHGIYSYASERLGDHFAGNAFSEPFERKSEAGGFDYRGLLQIPFAFGAVMIRSDVVNSIEKPFRICYFDCDDGDKKCIAHNKQNKEQNCKTVYYKGINGEDQSMWGMMFKQIQEQGIIPFVCNLHDFGHILL